MEDRVYDGIDDYLRYVRRWARRWDTPLTASSIKEYGSAVWNQWLARRYGAAIVRSAWAAAIALRPGGFSVARLRRGDSRGRALRPRPRLRPLRRRRRRVAHREGVPGEPAVPRPATPGVAAAQREAAEATAQPHDLHAAAGARSLGRGGRGPRDGAARRRRRRWLWSAAAAASGAVEPSPGWISAAAAAGSRCDWATRGATPASPPSSSTPTPTRPASARAGSIGATWPTGSPSRSAASCCGGALARSGTRRRPGGCRSRRPWLSSPEPWRVWASRPPSPRSPRWRPRGRGRSCRGRPSRRSRRSGRN